MNLLRVFLFSLICVFVAQSVRSQVTVVPSKNKVVIDGKKFYLHIVQKDETVYSISRAYNVSERDIVLNNPETYEVVKIGQELKIPIKSQEMSAQTSANSQFQPVQFIYHIAEKGQTVFWLTQRYSISQEELYRHNPTLEHSALQAGQVVTIPQKANEALSSMPKTGHVIHTVKRGETVFSISKSYQVDINEIFELNPEINSKNPKISIRQQIKIPSPDRKSTRLNSSH